jgi:hypothetical protein
MCIFKPRLVIAGEPPVEIVKGVYVMLDNGFESFWVHVAHLYVNVFMGIVCSRLKKSRSYNFGDIIQFQKQNILDILHK